jgi:hypothetical protein
VNGCFRSGKYKYFLDMIIARLTKGAETSIFMAFVVICAEKIWRLLRLFFVIISAWFYAFPRPGYFWMALRNLWKLGTGYLLLPIEPSFQASYTRDPWPKSRRIAFCFSGVPKYEKIHVAVDDAICQADLEVLHDEPQATTVGFLTRAVGWFSAQGIICHRVLWDNGSSYRSGE